jgi:hypothetical protein
MPRYSFHLQDGFAEDLALDLPDDNAAIEEGLKTASGMLREFKLPAPGQASHLLEVRLKGDKDKKLLRIEIQATRT